ncbi:hypothetical protein M9Y10_023217 [Tritrichomonas musculus]|uniref:BTB domain-containing protein n=1 Tax=Tritrichomonas musculus TaxID=1915356 RepID=A0ABR2KUK3_9EUKA
MISDEEKEENHKIIIKIGYNEIDCSNSQFLLDSPLIRNSMNYPINIDMDVNNDELCLIQNFLQKGLLILDSQENYTLFSKLNKFIRLPQLADKLLFFNKTRHIQNFNEYEILFQIYETIFSFDKDSNIEETINQSKEIILQSGTEIFVRTVFYAILSKPLLTREYISILRNLPEQTESIPTFIEIFISEFKDIYKNHIFKNEILYIAHFLISKGYIDIRKLFSKSDIQNIDKYPLLLIDLYGIDPLKIPSSMIQSNFFYENLSSLSENNWELHKKLVNKGINPNPIAVAIQSDDLKSLESLSLSPYFDPNMNLENSIYERSSICSRNINLIEYALFNRSYRCFRFLRNIGSKLDDSRSMKFLICSNSPINIQPEEFRKYFDYAVYYHNYYAIESILRLQDMNINKLFEKAQLMIRFCEFRGLLFLLQIGPLPPDFLKALINCSENYNNDILVEIIKRLIEIKDEF